MATILRLIHFKVHTIFSVFAAAIPVTLRPHRALAQSIRALSVAMEMENVDVVTYK